MGMADRAAFSSRRMRTFGSRQQKPQSMKSMSASTGRTAVVPSPGFHRAPATSPARQWTRSQRDAALLRAGVDGASTVRRIRRRPPGPGAGGAHLAEKLQIFRGYRLQAKHVIHTVGPVWHEATVAARASRELRRPRARGPQPRLHRLSLVSTGAFLPSSSRPRAAVAVERFERTRFPIS
jgi:hypothetical protein